ncbi:hypothetical protein [Neobacillus citreus]|uniref:FAD/FMN-containing dehydrogenase n=1 Tax=Neobacillus citreus TaxID=2833578 RepID=A0A9J6MZ51_9BACI|nr:hypothetical protein [Neobacillus citreus]
MKKLAFGLFSAALILGAGTAVFAAGNNNTGDGLSFDKMLPFMQKMHPDSSKQELEDMYKACHENGGMMGGTSETKSENMMNQF